ncbi:MAG: TonB-dependent receptor [Bacteroidota bacterium]
MTYFYSWQGRIMTIIMLFFATTTFAQTGSIVGTITDIKGISLPGANVRVSQSTLGAATDRSGNFSLNLVPSGPQTIIITLVGYQRIEQIISVPEYAEVRLDVTLIEDVLQLSEVAVTATRREEDISQTPRAVDVISNETIDFYANQTSDLSATLGKFVPNFTSPSVGNDVFTATLRGRAPLFLLDGVPLQTNEGLRGAVLGNLDPAAIERIEVLYGASTIYGGGAPGGVIQFFTKEPSEKPIDIDLQLFSRTYAVDGAFLDSEAVDYRTSLTISGTSGKFSYLVNGASEFTNGQFRPDGQRIAPNGTSAYDDFSVLAKVGYDLSYTQSVDFMVNRSYREPNDLFYEPIILERDVLADPEGAAAIGNRVPTAFSYDNPISQEYTALNLRYENTALLGGVFRIQGYYFDLNFQQGGSDIRPFLMQNGGGFPDTWPGLFQTSTAASQYGARTEYVRSLGENVLVTLGGGILWADDSTPVTLSTDGPFDEENRFDGAGGVQDQGAPTELFNGGAFLQADYDVTDELRLSGGARFDVISFDVLPFIPTFTRVQPGQQRLGGSGSNSGLSLNLGASYEVIENTNLYANFAQGFSLPSLAFLVVNVAPNVEIEGDEIVSPQIVNSVDFGVRGKLGNNFAYGLAGFYAFSEDGSQIQFDAATGFGERVQAPQRNYGFEVTLEAAPAKGFRVGANLSITETDVDPQDDGTFQPASTVETIPLTTSIRTSYELQSVPGLAFTAELFTVGNRTRAFTYLVDSDADGQIDLDANGNAIRADGYQLRGFSTVDVGASYRFPKEWLGNVGGSLAFQVLNLLNETYVPPISQRQFGEVFANRRRNGFGRNVTVTLAFDF